jgi:serine/threonine protein kinase
MPDRTGQHRTGQVIQGYKLTQFLGRREFADVYVGQKSAWRDGEERTAVIKIASSIDSSKWEAVQQRFFALTMPIPQYILPVMDFSRQAGEFRVVLKYPTNGWLRQRHPRGSVLPLPQIITYIKQIAEAVQTARSVQLTHLVLSPEQLFLDKDDAILLDVSGDVFVEFDSQGAKATDDTPSSPHYTAREQQGQKGAQANAASDQYSLAALVWEWLTGEPPTVDPDEDEDDITLLAPQRPAPAVARAVQEVVQRGLAEQPGDRFPTVQAFIEALEEAQKPPRKGADRAGQQLGEYRLLKCLAQEPPLFLYQGEAIKDKHPVLVKIVEGSADLEAVFQTELTPVVGLRHPSLVSVLDFGRQEDALYVVVDQPTQDSLGDAARRWKPLPLATVVTYINQLAEALGHAQQECGLAHAALKPGTILVQQDQALVVDFSSWVLDALLAEMGSVRTISEDDQMYKPSGLISAGRPQGVSSDQLPLGALVYEWLTGKPPYERRSGLLALHLREKHPAMTPAIEGVVLTALEPDPQYRFPNMRAFAAAMERAAQIGSIQPSPNLVGKQLGRYKLLRVLGAGTYGVVYLGEHVHVGGRAAIKVLSGTPAPEDLKRFTKEARTIATLEDRHVVRFFDYDDADGVAYLVMEYAPSGTLLDRHPRGVRLPPERVVRYITQVAEALQEIHDARLVHRDLKPGNLLLTRRGEVLLSDFGVALALQQTVVLGREHNFAGTPLYAAPEQFQNNKPGIACDQYALAVMAYEWLTGTWPFEGDWLAIMYKKVNEAPPTLRDKVPTLSAALEQVVLKGLATAPEKRYEGVTAFAAALEEASKQQP